jgi:hypothetical protein
MPGGTKKKENKRKRNIYSLSLGQLCDEICPILICSSCLWFTKIFLIIVRILRTRTSEECK